MPNDWVNECVLPLYKGKGDKCECTDFSHVSLLNVAGNVYDKVLVKRIREGTDGMICDDQGGLRKQRGSMDQIFIVRQLCKIYLAKVKTYIESS